MKTGRKEIGQLGEKIAAWYLRKNGYTILGSHYTTRWGELDLIAQNQQGIVFVEVKSRTNNKFGFPEEAITESKIKRLVRTIDAYLQKENVSTKQEFSLDAILIKFSLNQKKATVQHVKNVFLFSDSNEQKQDFEV